jgi:hypothetical protein
MYRNPKAKIKLLNKLFKVIEVNFGTEQGRPMSPELLKISLLDLSEELNIVDSISVPQLNGTDTSHIL